MNPGWWYLRFLFNSAIPIDRRVASREGPIGPNLLHVLKSKVVVHSLAEFLLTAKILVQSSELTRGREKIESDQVPHPLSGTGGHKCDANHEERDRKSVV